MGLKIKWNDDRVREATTAILLIGRDRLFHGLAADLVQASLADYRNNPEHYKLNKAALADSRELGPLRKPAHVAHYRSLLAAVDALLKKMERNKRQSNSLLELDNHLVSSLRNVR